MTEKEPEINDPSLLRCTVKKSIQVTKKWALYVTVLAALSLIGYAGYLGLPTLVMIAGTVATVIGLIISILVSIPWYFYVGAIAIAAIPVYSFAWCVARDLTDEDWNSDTAKHVAITIALAFALAFAFAFAFAPAFAFTLAFTFAFAFALFIILAITFAFSDAADAKALLFIGAYMHYRKRMKLQNGK